MAPRRAPPARAATAATAAAAAAAAVARRPKSQPQPQPHPRRAATAPPKKQAAAAPSTTASPASIPPTPSRVPAVRSVSLPPAVAGTVQSALRVSVPKLVWSANTPSPGTARGKASRAARGPVAVDLAWWGDDGPPAVFVPTIVGLRLADGAFSDAAGNRVQVVRHPVRCDRERLQRYLQDMGPLVLKVRGSDDAVLGEVHVPDVSCVAGLPYSRPVNGWFPIIQQTGREKRDVGELNVSVVLEAGTPDDDAERAGIHPLNLVATEEHKSETESEVDDRDAYITEAGDILYIKTATGPYHDFAEELPVPDITQQHDRVHPERNIATLTPSPLEINNGAPSNAEPQPAFAMPQMSVEPQPLPSTNDSQAAITDAADMLYIQILDRALNLRREIDAALHQDSSTEGKPAFVSNSIPRPADSPRSELGIPGHLDDLHLYGSSLASDEDFAEDSYTDSALDDDIIIKALNAGAMDFEADKGKTDAPHIMPPHLPELAKSSGDAPPSREMAPPPSSVKITDTVDPASGLSLDTCTALGRVHSVRIHMGKLAMSIAPHNRTIRSFMISFRADNVASATGDPLYAEFRVPSALKFAAGGRRPPSQVGLSGASSVLEVDRQSVFPVSFDAASVRSWLSSTFRFSVASSALGAAGAGGGSAALRDGGNGAARPVYSAAGSWRCREVVAAGDFLWIGKVPLFSSDSPAGGARAGPRRPLSRHVGDLSVTVELVSVGPVAPAVLDAERPPHRADHVGDLQALLREKDKIPLEPALLPPAYLFLSITTARALRIPSSHAAGPPATPVRCLLNLVVRPFAAAGGQAITTPPKPHFFGPDTAFSFEFSTTFPMIVTRSVLESIEDAALIVEVWLTALESTSASSEGLAAAPTEGAAGLTEDGRQLLGLLKLPTNNLLRILSSAGAGSAMLGESGLDAPVVMPETDYPIIDPFSGSPTGWVTAFLAVGSWSQIKPFRARENRHSIASEVDFEAGAGGTAKAELGAMKKSLESVMRLRTKAARPAEELGEKRLESDSDESPALVIEVTIHRACGLRGLLDGLLKTSRKRAHSEDDCDAAELALEYAREAGANVSAVLTFPTTIPTKKRAGAGAGETAAGFRPRVVRTPVVVRSFTPEFGDGGATTAVRGEGPETQLVRWMRGGGALGGEVRHHGGGGAGGAAGGVVIGRFDVPLGRLVQRPYGVCKEWMVVQGVEEGSDEDGPVRAAVQVSARIVAGFDFGESLDGGAGLALVGTAAASAWCFTMVVEVAWVAIPAEWVSGSDETGSVRLKWSYPKPGSGTTGAGADGAGWETFESAPHVVSRAASLSGTPQLVRADLHLSWEAAVDFRDATVKAFAARGFVVDVLCTDAKGQDATAVVGQVYVGVEDVLNECRRVHRRPREAAARERLVVEGVWPIICATAADLGGATAAIRVQLRPEGLSGAGSNSKRHLKARVSAISESRRTKPVTSKLDRSIVSAIDAVAGERPPERPPRANIDLASLRPQPEATDRLPEQNEAALTPSSITPASAAAAQVSNALSSASAGPSQVSRAPESASQPYGVSNDNGVLDLYFDDSRRDTKPKNSDSPGQAFVSNPQSTKNQNPTAGEPTPQECGITTSLLRLAPASGEVPATVIASATAISAPSYPGLAAVALDRVDPSEEFRRSLQRTVDELAEIREMLRVRKGDGPDASSQNATGVVRLESSASTTSTANHGVRATDELVGLIFAPPLTDLRPVAEATTSRVSDGKDLIDLGPPHILDLPLQPEEAIKYPPLKASAASTPLTHATSVTPRPSLDANLLHKAVQVAVESIGASRTKAAAANEISVAETTTPARGLAVVAPTANAGPKVEPTSISQKPLQSDAARFRQESPATSVSSLFLTASNSGNSFRGLAAANRFNLPASGPEIVPGGEVDNASGDSDDSLDRLFARANHHVNKRPLFGSGRDSGLTSDNATPTAALSLREADLELEYTDSEFSIVMPPPARERYIRDSNSFPHTGSHTHPGRGRQPAFVSGTSDGKSLNLSDDESTERGSLWRAQLGTGFEERSSAKPRRTQGPYERRGAPGQEDDDGNTLGVVDKKYSDGSDRRRAVGRRDDGGAGSGGSVASAVPLGVRRVQDEDFVGPIDGRYLDGSAARRSVGTVADGAPSVRARGGGNPTDNYDLGLPRRSMDVGRRVADATGEVFGSDDDDDDDDCEDEELRGVLARARRIVAEAARRKPAAGVVKWSDGGGGRSAASSYR